MSRVKAWGPVMGLAIVALTAWPSLGALAQDNATPPNPWQTRTWPELKTETLARANRNPYPLTGLKPDDVGEALSHVESLDRDQWAEAFMAVGDRYRVRAESELHQHPDAARDDYYQAWLNYAFGRWPSSNSPRKLESAAKAKAAFIAYGQLLTPKIEVLQIPFEGKNIVAYLQKPLNVARAPIVIDIGGADEWKDAGAYDGRNFLKDGIADVAVDMPGTGEAPLPGRPGSERMYSALIDFLQTRGDLDGNRIIVRGVSWGSYWATRVAHAEPKRLMGAVFQSGPVDAYFARTWQEKALHTQEYLFDFVASRLYILGEPSVDAMLDFMPSMSLKPLLDKPTPPMLVIGGVHDTQNPFSDVLLLLQSGSPKYAWVNPVGGHMGRSQTWGDNKIFDEVVRPWIAARLNAG